MRSNMIVDKIEDMYDLTDFQTKLISEYKEAPGEGLHLMNLVFDYEGQLDDLLFRKSWQKIIDKYSCFRTSFHSENMAKPLQVVRNDTEFSYDIIDLTGYDAKERKMVFGELMAEDRKRDFILERAPLMRIDIVLEEEGRFKIWWRFPEMLMDGWNIPIIIRNFLEFYRAFQAGINEPDTSPVFPYRDYVAWLKRRDLTEEKIFWTAFLKNHTPLEIPCQKKKTSSPASTGRTDLSIAHLYENLTQWARENEITLNALFQGTVFLVMDALYGRGALDFTIGTTVADRPLELADSQNRVGLYLNTLPFRCRCTGDSSFVGMVRRFHKEMMELLRFTSSSETMIRNWCQTPATSPLYTCMLIFENMPVHADDYSGLGFNLITYNFENRPATPLNFFVWPGKEMNLKLIYDTRIYSAEEIDSLLDEVHSLLTTLVSEGDMTIDALKTLGA